MAPIPQVVAATSHFREAIRAAPAEPSNYVQLMHALFLDDQRVELAEWMLRYEELFPERTNSHTFQFNFAMTLYGLYRRSEALERFLRCLGICYCVRVCACVCVHACVYLCICMYVYTCLYVLLYICI